MIWNDLTEELIELGVAQKQQAVESLSLWDKLTLLQKEVVALVCFGVYEFRDWGEAEHLITNGEDACEQCVAKVWGEFFPVQ